MKANLSGKVREQLGKDFAPDEAREVAEILDRYQGNERERVQIDILLLAAGSRAEVSELVEHAARDYRDVIYWAEYPEDSRLDTPEKKQKMRELFEQLGLEVPEQLQE